MSIVVQFNEHFEPLPQTKVPYTVRATWYVNIDQCLNINQSLLQSNVIDVVLVHIYALFSMVHSAGLSGTKMGHLASGLPF